MKSSTITLLQLLRTGSLFQIQCGITENALLEMAGAPEDVGITTGSQDRPQILKYGDIQFGLDSRKSTVLWIGIYFWGEAHTARGGSSLSFDSSPIRGDTGIDVFCKWLIDNEIDWIEDKSADNESRTLRIGNVAVIFAIDDNQDSKLEKVIVYSSDL